MKIYVRSATYSNEAYTPSKLQQAAKGAKELKYNIGNMLDSPEYTEPRFRLSSDIVDNLLHDPDSDGIARLCFAVINPKTKQFDYATDGDLLFYAVSEEEYQRKLRELGYENLIVKTLYVGVPNTHISLTDLSDLRIKFMNMIAQQIKADFNIDPKLVTDSYGGLLLEINNLCDLYVLYNTFTNKTTPTIEVDKSGAPFTRFLLSFPVDFTRSDMSQAFNKLYPKIYAVLNKDSDTDTTYTKGWPDSEFWMSIDSTDPEEFEEACIKYLNKYMDSVETKLQVSCIPSTVGMQGSIDIFDESGLERFEAVDVPYVEWVEKICDLAAESNSGRGFVSKYKNYIESLINLN